MKRLRAKPAQLVPRRLRVGAALGPEGVMCELYHDMTGEGEWFQHTDGWRFRLKAGSAQKKLYAPAKVKYFFGTYGLTRLSDRGMSLSQIADEMEKQV